MRTDAGSWTFSSLPTSCSKKIAAMGVTYSWLNRMSVTTNPSSPGLTARTPTFPLDGSTTQWRARIFSPSVIRRGGGSGGGGVTLTPALAAHRGDKTTAFHRAASDGKLVAALEPQVGKVAQGFVVVIADVSGGDLVGGDVVAEPGLGMPIDVLSRELPAHQLRVLG